MARHRIFTLLASGASFRRPGNLLPVLLSLLALGWPIPSLAAYSFNFPEPVTPIARETLNIHNEFMLVITVLFVAVFAIMIY